MGPNFPFLASKWHLIASKYPKLAKEKLVQTLNILHLYRSLKHQSDNFLQLQKIVDFTELSTVTLNRTKVLNIKVTIFCKENSENFEAFFLRTKSCILSYTFTEHD